MASPDGLVDLRSDTVTRPTDAMRAAMAAAEVGDDVYGEDPTVKRLESLAAALLGTEAALYVPSGVMANQVAIAVLSRPGSEVLCAERAHVLRYEDAAAARNSGVQMRGLPDADGLFGVSDVERALASGDHHMAGGSLLCVENTHMPACGRPWTAGEVAAVAAVARARGLPVYCDGARIWNAAVALGVPPSDLVAPCDAAMFCLSKGLAAPVGSVLCGSRTFVDEARAQRRRFGGAMRQSGVIAAAGLVALETMVERLADDHARAARLAEGLADRFPGSVDPAGVRTNVVCCAAAALPADLLPRLEADGILAGTIDAETVRFVTHKDLDDADVERVLAALQGLADSDR